MVKENYIMLMEIYLKVNELMIKQMVMEYIFILMELNMKDNERMINKMAKGKNNGQMGLFIQVIM